MKREELLMRLKTYVPQSKKKRVIISSDVKNEADDPFAIMHHLMTPSEDVMGIISCHYEESSRMMEELLNSPIRAQIPQTLIPGLEKIADMRGKTENNSYVEGKKILELAGIDDVPMIHGSKYELQDIEKLPESPGADFIIDEAMKDDRRPLFIALQGAITDLAIAYLKEPSIADRLTAIWIGGGAYPDGGDELVLCQEKVQLKNDLFSSFFAFDSPHPSCS